MSKVRSTTVIELPERAIDPLLEVSDVGEPARTRPRPTRISVECAAPWGTYRYSLARDTSCSLRDAMERVERRLDDQVCDECRRYGAGVQNKAGDPVVEAFNELAMGAHERARDERIRDACRASGWVGEQDSVRDVECVLASKVEIRLRVRHESYARDDEYWAINLGLEPRMVRETIGAYLRGNASSMTAEEHLCRLAMGVLMGELDGEAQRG